MEEEEETDTEVVKEEEKKEPENHWVIEDAEAHILDLEYEPINAR